MHPDLAKACEVVFQEHKFSTIPIPWNKDVFRGRVSLGMSEKAKETLLDLNVIYYPNKAKRLLTLINPEVVTASSFEEAAKWAITKKNTLTSSSVNVSYPIAKSLVATESIPIVPDSKKSASKSAQYVYVSQESSGKLPNNTSVLKWHLKPYYYYGLVLTGAALIGVVIAWLLGTLATAI